MTKIVGFSASLRNARSLEGAKDLVEDIKTISSQKELTSYLEQQGNLHLEHYFKAGREKNLPFDQLFKELKKSKGIDGLSNSEICLATALWGAFRVGCEIELLPLAHFFPTNQSLSDEELLRISVIEADGIIISTPVYFGDRSSLSQKLLDFFRLDVPVRKALAGKFYGGVTVGAKRNGGQETALIYQMHDVMNLGALGVGNDYITTSQYGGTGHAGDIATMAKDEYGLNTCVGTGRRVARVAKMHSLNKKYKLKSKVRIGVLILQDKDKKLSNYLETICNELTDAAHFEFIDLTTKNILPCLACDICPCRIGEDQDYRCVLGKKDDMHSFHKQLLECDVIIPSMLSPRNPQGLLSTYQQFLERTRYIRRGDYALSDRLIAPLVVSEVGCSENLNIRMITSLIRHHTIMHKPVLGWYQDNTLLNRSDIIEGFESVIKRGTEQTVARLASGMHDENLIVYKPIGYVLSSCKNSSDDSMQRREKAIHMRLNSRKKEFANRVQSIS